MRRMIPLAAIWLVATLFSGCDGGEDPQSGDQGNSSDASGQGLFGEWRGTYSDTSDDPDLSLSDVEAEVILTKAQEANQEHSFKVVMKSQNIAVSGTFGRFDNETLLFEIKSSNLSTIGEPGSMTEVKYKVQGQHLKLYNDRFSILAKRHVEGGDEDGDGGEGGNQGSGKKLGPFLGFWACDPDPTGNNWTIEITASGHFRADIRSSGLATLWQNGSVKVDEKASNKAVLTVESSNVTKYVDDQLHVIVSGVNMSVTRHVRESGKYVSKGSFSCYKAD